MRSRRLVARVVVASGAALVIACGSSPKPTIAAQKVEVRWMTSVRASNPLVGKAYDVQKRALVAPGRAEAATFDARFVLLGEKHDNPDHHRLQAHALEALVARGRRPAVLFEMIDLDLQPALDAYVARGQPTVDGLATVLEWDKRGWPAWSMYRPIFEVALAARLKIVATGLSREIVHRVVKEGLSALPPDIAARVRLKPLAPGLAASLDAEIKASHCGMLPDSMIAPMSLVQRVKDAWMAALMVAQATAGGAVLVAGNGHTRGDRGVPYYLAALEPSARAVTVSFVEVNGASEPSGYAADEPASFLVFTPRVDDDDPCAKFRHGG